MMTPMADAHAEPPAHARRGSASNLSLILALAGMVVIAVGLRATSAIFAPTFFALTLVLAARPVQRWLVQRRVPPVLAATIVLVALYVVLLVLITALGLALVQLYDTVPAYFDEFGSVYTGLVDQAERFGVAKADVDSLIGSLEFGGVVNLIGDVLDSLSAATSQLVLVVMVMFFLAFDSLNAGRRWRLLDDAKPELAEALTHFAVVVRRYWLVSTLFGLVVAVIDVVALLALGVPLALTWGLLAFVTNYIPNVGFVLGLVPPALLALLDSGPVTMVWVIVIYSVVNFTIQSLIQPKFTGDAVGLSPTVTFLSLVFWALVMGPLGALLAVPLTLFAKAVLVDADPAARWANAFLVTGREVVPPPGPRSLRQRTGGPRTSGVLDAPDEREARDALGEHPAPTDAEPDDLTAPTDAEADGGPAGATLPAGPTPPAPPR